MIGLLSRDGGLLLYLRADNGRDNGILRGDVGLLSRDGIDGDLGEKFNCGMYF